MTAFTEIDPAKNARTPLRVSQNCEAQKVTAHLHQLFTVDTCAHEVPRAEVTLRRIGWIDQAGVVWVSEKDWRQAGGPNGSITPLLINPGCD